MDRTIRSATDKGGELADLAGQLQESSERIAKTTAAIWSAGDLEVSLANASVYLEAVGHVVLAWIWLEQLLAADGRTGDFYDGKRQAGRYFFRWELPRTAAQFALLETLDRTTLDTSPDWF
jgi:butyryl-CoA dehydrogenase